MFDFLLPTYVCDNTYDIDYKSFYDKGYRGIIFDIDNTLVFHDKKSNDTVCLLIKSLHDIGYKVIILSNNNKKRVEDFCIDSGIKYFIYKANKPSKYSYDKASKILNIDKKNILCIGDQLFTDIWGANNANIDSILVKPLGKEIYFHISIKRFFENIVKTINKNSFNNKI